MKVRLWAYTDIEGFIVFECRNRKYGIPSNLEYLFYPGLDPYIYRINKDSTFELATDLQNDIDDVIHALMIKSENFYEQVVYLDEFTYEVIDEFEEFAISENQMKFLSLFPDIVAFDRKYIAENEEILNIMVMDEDNYI